MEGSKSGGFSIALSPLLVNSAFYIMFEISSSSTHKMQNFSALVYCFFIPGSAPLARVAAIWQMISLRANLGK